MKSIIAVILPCATANWNIGAGELSVMPQPQSLTRLDGVFNLAPSTWIYTDRASVDTGKFLSERLRQSTSYKFRVSGMTGLDLESQLNGDILLTTNGAAPALGAEGCELSDQQSRRHSRAGRRFWWHGFLWEHLLDT